MKGHNTGGYYQCLMYVGLRTFDTLHKNPRRIGTGLRIMLGHELRRIPLPRTPVNKGKERRLDNHKDERPQAMPETPRVLFLEGPTRSASSKARGSLHGGC